MRVLRLFIASLLRFTMAAVIVVVAFAIYLPAESAIYQSKLQTHHVILETKLPDETGHALGASTDGQPSGTPPHTSPIPPVADPQTTKQPTKFHCDACQPATQPDEYTCGAIACYPCPPCTPGKYGAKMCPMVSCRALEDASIDPALQP